MGQARPQGPEDAFVEPVETYVARVLSLTDEQLQAVAAARAAVDEEFHLGALAAAAEAVVGRAEEYVRVRRLLARAHVPRGLDDLSGDARARAQHAARLAQLAIDDGLLAHLTGDVIHPKHVRELYRSFHVLDF